METKHTSQPAGTVKREGHGVGGTARALIKNLPDDFDPEVYYHLNPDVRDAELDAAQHFLRWGYAEGRPYRVEGAPEVMPEPAKPVVDVVPNGFDPEVYYQLNPDVRDQGIDAAEHFLNFGRAEGRPWRNETERKPVETIPDGFDPEVYYRLNPDVLDAGIDAADHFVKWGRAEGRQWYVVKPHFATDYNRVVSNLLATKDRDEAMSLAVGGSFQRVGELQLKLVEQTVGLSNDMTIVDLGCGSGRTATQIGKQYPSCRYIGFDVVHDLLAYAREICPPNYLFAMNTRVDFPVASSTVDLILGFSVFTHLTHDETYAYLTDARRILKPGGHIAFSFLEFARPDHWHVFQSTVDARKHGPIAHMNTFIERPVIEAWINRLGLTHMGYFTELGQTMCVLSKPPLPNPSKRPAGMPLATLRRTQR